MAKFISSNVIDGSLVYLQQQVIGVSACGTQPTTYAQATATTYSLGTAAIASANWTIAAGDSSGRKITLASTNIPLTASGTVNHLAFWSAGTLHLVGTCAPTAVTSGGTIVVAAWDADEIGTIA
jgi:hypothetical protein